MSFSEHQLERLRAAVEARLGEKRFRHTLGVEQAAMLLGEYLCPERVPELRAAALLHDITKELTPAEQLEILAAENISDPDDLASAPVHHSLTAPSVIKREFPEFATEDVLSAVRNHTTGASPMSVFDEIIFISDYIEDGRVYEGCRSVRRELLDGLYREEKLPARLTLLHRAVLSALNNTAEGILARGLHLHGRTNGARNYVLGILATESK